VLRKSVTGFEARSGFGVRSGLGLDVLSGDGLATSTRVGLASGFDMISSLDFVVFAELDLLNDNGAGLSSESSTLGVAATGFVSFLKSDVSSRVVGAASFSAISNVSWARVLVGLEARPAGFALVGGVIDLVLPMSDRRSLESDRFKTLGPKGMVFVGDLGRPGSASADAGVPILAGPKGVLFVGDLGLPVSSSAWSGGPVLGVESALSLCAFARARFSIQLGAVFFAGDNFGESGFANALSIQLVFVGLQRLEGLLGGDVAPSCSAVVLYVDATDLLRL